VIVPDASATLLLFTPNDPRSERVDDELSADPAWVVPEHWRTEVLSGLRGLVLGGKLATADAELAVGWLGRITVAVMSTGPHLERIWQLRSNLSVYDAGYVAVAEQHDATLVTADARIEKAGVAHCTVRVIT
jgi:predicted nucleic acid-binding protein